MMYRNAICFYIVTVLCLVWISGGSAQCSCYTFNGTPLKLWSEAQTLCRDNNGELVSMETLEEWEFIKTQIQNRTTEKGGDDEWWIGLEKRDERWVWLSNNTLTYNKWQKDKPDPNKEIIHVIMAKNYPSGTYGLFHNKRSYLQKGTICEYKGAVCSGHQVTWCSPTSSTTITTQHPVTKRPVVKTATNTPYNNKPTHHGSITYQQNTTPLQVHKEGDSITSDHHKLANTDCLPYSLLVTAIFVCVLGGLTVLATVAFFLVPIVLKKSRSSVV